MQHILHSSLRSNKKKEYQHSISHKTNMYLYDAYKRTISYYSSHSNEKAKKKKEKEYHKTQEIKIEIVEVVDRTQQPWTRRPERGRRL